jgi:hypothetical protein
MEKLLHNVSELPAPTRSAVEGLMGHPLRDSQQLYIVAIDEPLEPTLETRREAWIELQGMMAEMREAAGRSGLASDKIERIIDESCEEVRYGTKPCG